MSAVTASPATPAHFQLAEGILWDDRSNALKWVDIWRGQVLSGVLNAGQIDEVASIDIGQTAGAIALAEDGGLLIAAARGLAVIAPDGVLSFGPDLLGAREAVRLNDGSVDPQGRFVVGSLSLREETGTEVLLRVSADGTVETLRSGIRLSNGIAFSPDGRTIYHVDTLANTVSRHSYSVGPFDVDEQWDTVLRELPSLPDGLTVSSDGSLWVALWGGSAVHRYSTDGELMDVVEVSATQVSCAAFVGRDLDTLAITTAQEGLDEWSDDSGALFLASPGATGIASPRWAGSTSTPYWYNEKEPNA